MKDIKNITPVGGASGQMLGSDPMDEIASLRSRLSAVEKERDEARRNHASCEAAFARWKAETAKDVAALEDMRVQRDVRQQYGDRMKDERDLFKVHCVALEKALTILWETEEPITKAEALVIDEALDSYRKDSTP